MANRVDAGEEEICNFEEIQGHRWSSSPEKNKNGFTCEVAML